MKSQLFKITLIFSIICSLGACKSTTTLSNIPYTQAERYFVKNTVKDGSILMMRISSAKTFDEYFGAAAVMRANGKPTTIEFDKQCAIAIIHPSTENNTTFSNYTLQKSDNKTIFSYKIEKGEKQSFTSRPFLLLIVDRESGQNLQFSRIP